MKKIPESASQWKCKACEYVLTTGQMCLLKQCPQCKMVDTLEKI